MMEFDVKIDETDFLNRLFQKYGQERKQYTGKAALKTDWSEGAEKDIVRTEDWINSQAV